ncbi:alpha-D-ribose 1-methylphosphonate 5-triphosphate diphosphatase [Qingshengfaniella alkalisoli]|uniref:Alpha-D-ribose 1-methylphosphonate 5-triphosphate diphosphatase n=1 Tax=Qingshengfaniella alkalisoli TaxID=2599296 RepID=A0A5B8ICV2_9RHOB|nr:alpha-D-ribose 1-methylphosphonate 5-triphosphate diphosphatase [Qingshengfaniella alkalisoli]QDY71436.1 alpha-D-ribose 1-methylphosphonate 5-triphosphate diphosphatase [Qingshengfaniella alkalisoli]
MTTETIFTNARIVLADEVIDGSLTVRDGIIIGIEVGKRSASNTVDCNGDYLSPGLIELHTDNLERHIEPRPDVDWPHASAIIAHDAELAGVGITTVFDALRLGVIANVSNSERRYARQLATELIEMRSEAALKISHFLHLRAEVCSETLMEELDEFGPEDRVGIVSLMDHTPGQRQFRDIDKLRAYVMGKRGLNEEQFQDHVASLTALRDRHGDRHEAAVVEAASRYGAVLASHDDTTADHVDLSASYGVGLAEFPTTLEAARQCHAQGIAVMMGAPNLIRGGSHSGNVAAAELAEAGLLDVVSSDYVPAALLQAAVLLGDLWDNIARGLHTVTAAPAKAAGLTDRGSLDIGKRADLLRFQRKGRLVLPRGVWVRGARVA